MEKVAEHINEMQRIHEEYGAIFDHLFRQHQKACKQPIDLSPGELIIHTILLFLNNSYLNKNLLTHIYTQVIFCIMEELSG